MEEEMGKERKNKGELGRSEYDCRKRKVTGLSEMGMDVQGTFAGAECYPDHAAYVLLYGYAWDGRYAGRNAVSGIETV